MPDNGTGPDEDFDGQEGKRLEKPPEGAITGSNDPDVGDEDGE